MFFTPFAFIQDPEALAIAIQQYLLIGGDFTTFNVPNYGGIVRTNLTGSVDSTFNMGTGFNNIVSDAQYQSDGKLVVGGQFTTYSGSIPARIARINTDGTIDNTFTSGVFNSTVSAIAIQSDGKIVAGGSFTTYSGSAANRIIRLNSNGTIDNTFNVGTGFDNVVYTIVQEPSGKLLIGGVFTTYSGSSSNRIIRLNTNGTSDAINFGIGTGFNGNVNTIGLQPDGKIVVGGTFSTFNTNITTVRMARLLNSGSYDSGFLPFTFFDNGVNNLKIQPDGKIVVVGEFTNKIARVYLNGNQITADPDFKIGTGFNSFTNIPTPNTIQIDSNKNIYITNNFTRYSGSNAPGVVKLLPSGAIDTSFNTGLGIQGTTLQNVGTDPYGSGTTLSGSTVQIFGQFSSYAQPYQDYLSLLSTTGNTASFFNMGSGFNNTVNSTVTQSNGNIIVGGQFTTYSGSAASRIVRLNTSGTIDNTFLSSSGFNATVNDLVMQPDGKIVACGTFTSYSGSAQNRIIRLNTDGTRDTTFNSGTGFNTNVSAMAIQPDGKIVAVGFFATYSGSAASRIVRLNTDGTIDNTFLSSSGFNAPVNDVSIQSDGKIVVGGSYSTYNNFAASRIVRLNTSGTIDNTFLSSSGFNSLVNATAIQPDGKILVAGGFTSYSGSNAFRIARLNTDGTIDNTFVTTGSLGVGISSTANSIAVLSNGNIAVAGAFETYNVTQSANRIAIFNANGSFDSTFNQTISSFNGTKGGFNNITRHINILNI